MFRHLPWTREGLSVLFRLLLAVGLMEGVRSGYFAGLLPFYAPEKLHLAPPPSPWPTPSTSFRKTSPRASGGFWRSGCFGLTVSLAAFAGLLALLLTPMAQEAWLLWATGILWGISMSTLYPGLMTYASRIASRGGRPGPSPSPSAW